MLSSAAVFCGVGSEHKGVMEMSQKNSHFSWRQILSPLRFGFSQGSRSSNSDVINTGFVQNWHANGGFSISTVKLDPEA
jgi:hypothetical protein